MRSLALAVLLSAAAVLAAAAGFTAPSGTLALNNDPRAYRAMEREVLEACAALHERYAAALRLPRRKRNAALEEYRAAAKDFAEKWGSKGIEVLVRVTEDCLLPVMEHLAREGEWYQKMRALFWLYERRERSAAPLFLEALKDENPLVRETAAVGFSAVADPKRYKKEYAAALRGLAKEENDPFVREALAAADALLSKKKGPEEIYAVFSSGPEGRRIRPYMNGYRAPKGYAERRYSRSGKAAKLRPASALGYPVSGFHRKIIKGLSSVPFGGLKTPTVYHLGEDVAWFEDGAGFYAIADGVVRFVQHGGDWGGLIVVEHRVSEDEYCCALYGHAGRFLFVRPGDRVRCGQLLGMMGLSFSLENGGHGAHCHFGIFKGRFDPSKCVGYRARSEGLSDFHDPVRFLDGRVGGRYAGR